MASTSVKVFSSADPGALVLSGAAGSLLTLLKTYLVDGRGLSSVVSMTVASGIATAVYSAGHPFAVGSVGLFAGATPAGLNGEQRILTTASDRVTFAAPEVADGAATGTITSKLAPAGWQQIFSGTNLAAFKSSAVEATGCVLRIDDTGTTTCRVVGYELMTDAGAGVAPFPLNPQMAGGLWWPKSQAADTTARPWRLIASARALHLWVSPSTTLADRGTGMMFTFGDYRSYRSGDAYGCLITGATAAGEVATSIMQYTGCLGYGNGSASPAQAFVARGPLAVGGSLNVRKISAGNSAATYSGVAGYNSNVFPYPNAADNALRLAPLELHQSQYGLLGQVAGVHHCAQTLGDAFATDTVVQGEGVYAGKTLLALRVGPLSTGGTVFIDTTGPWEV